MWAIHEGQEQRYLIRHYQYVTTDMKSLQDDHLLGCLSELLEHNVTPPLHSLLSDKIDDQVIIKEGHYRNVAKSTAVGINW